MEPQQLLSVVTGTNKQFPSSFELGTEITVCAGHKDLFS